MTKKIFSLSEVNSAVNENDIEEIDLRFITITAKDAEIFSANLEKFTGLKSVNFLHLRFENDQARKIFYMD